MSLSPLTLPGGGSLALPSISVTPQGTLPHIDSSKIYSSFLVPSAGDGDEKTDSYVTSRPDVKKMNTVEKELDEEQIGSDDDDNKRKNLIKDIEKNVLAKSAAQKESESGHKPNLGKIFSLKANDRGSESLHDSLKEERKSFITAAMHQKQIPLASEQIGSPKDKADSKTKDKNSQENENPADNSDEKVPSVSEIERNPNSLREKRLDKHIHGVTLPPYASKNN